MAGNSNSGKSIAFRMSEKELEKKIQKFRDEYSEGQHGMVTWPQFCDFLGYSEREVMECYRHREEKKLREYEFKLLEQCYKAYKALGGNSFIDHIYAEMQEWEII